MVKRLIELILHALSVHKRMKLLYLGKASNKLFQRDSSVLDFPLHKDRESPSRGISVTAIFRNTHYYNE